MTFVEAYKRVSELAVKRQDSVKLSVSAHCHCQKGWEPLGVSLEWSLWSQKAHHHYTASTAERVVHLYELEDQGAPVSPEALAAIGPILGTPP